MIVNAPICSKEMNYQTNNLSIYEELFTCRNKCYFLQVTNHKRTFMGFGKRFVGYTNSTIAKKKKYDIKTVEKEVNELVDYWKENDRYLMKILSGDNND